MNLLVGLRNVIFMTVVAMISILWLEKNLSLDSPPRTPVGPYGPLGQAGA